MKYLLLPGLLCLAMLAGCAANPATGRQNLVMMSEADEIRTGQKADGDVRKEYGVYDLPALQQYVNQVGQRLARTSHRPNLTYHFTVVDSPEINAFALPGGYIYITRGILAYLSSEAELASVLGHEIGHVTARHSVQQYTAATVTNIGLTLGSILVPDLRSQGAQNLLGLLDNALLSGYGREHELEADRLGAEYLARAGYDPHAMIQVLSVLKNQELLDSEIAKKEGRQPQSYHGVFASHPDNDTRLQQVVGEADHLVRHGNTDEGRAPYLKHIDGIVYGSSPQQGLVRGSTFLHAGLGFALDFPQDWRIQNRPDQVLATSPGNDATLELRLEENPQGTPAEFVRQRLQPDPGSALETATINGLPAAILSGTKQGRPLKIGAIYLQRKAYVVIGLTQSPAQFDRYREAISKTIHSFHPLREGEKKLAQPLVIHTITAKKGMSFPSLARQSPLGKNAEGTLRLMNHAYPTGEPQPGGIIKIVQ